MRIHWGRAAAAAVAILMIFAAVLQVIESPATKRAVCSFTFIECEGE